MATGNKWRVSADSPLLVAVNPKTKRRKRDKPDENVVDLPFRIVKVDDDEQDTDREDLVEPAEYRNKDFTVEGIAQMLNTKNSGSWLAVRFGLVMRRRCERFRRVFFQEYLRASLESERLKQEARVARQGAAEDDERDIAGDTQAQQELVVERCRVVLQEINETLRLLKPTQEEMTRIRRFSRKNDADSQVPWGFDTLRKNLSASLQQLRTLVGLESSKQAIADYLVSALSRESVAMPGDVQRPATATPTRRSAAPRASKLDTLGLRREALANLLLSIKLTEDDELVPPSETEMLPGDKERLEHENFLLFGEPGTGKTTLAEFFTRIVGAAGILPVRENIQLLDATRADLVGRVAGETALKTRRAILRSLGTTLFVDELYTLIGGGDSNDSFGRESVDAIVPLLTQYKGLLGFIGAGYEDQIRERIFTANPGLETRLPNVIRIDSYRPCELTIIIQRKLVKQGYKLEDFIEGCDQDDAQTVLLAIVTEAYNKGLFVDKNARGAGLLASYIVSAQSRRALSQVTQQNDDLVSPDRLIKATDVSVGAAQWVASSSGYRVVYSK